MFHLKRFNTSQRGSSLQLNARLWLSALLWLSLAMHASAQNTSTPSVHSTPASEKATQPVNSSSGVAVGSVSFLIGQASVTRSGSSLPITAGMPLQVGDRLLTSLNGHIHVRFVDGAMVSLRPTSTLNIKEYRFDAQTPSNSEVRFELEQGVVRAISGQAAESAKDKFRLNTPLAAIGVKGTDFVVEASGSRVNAIVNQGAIVLAPFDAQCLASALGPCSTQFAKELTAALKGMALTYNMSIPSPQLLPMGQLKGSELLNIALPMGAISQSGQLGQSGPTANPSNLQLVQSNPENGANSGNAANAGNSGNSGNGSNSNSMTANRVQQNQVDGQAYSTVNQILNKTVSDTSLVWGRWGAANPQDNLTLAFKDAMQNRSVTVGDGYLFLFRQENNVANLLSAQQGNVNFTLQNSYAYFQDLGNNLNAAKVNSGTLGVNFSTLDVKTTLNLSTQPSANSVLGSSFPLVSTSASQANSQTPQTLSQTLSATAKLNPSSGIFLLSPLATPPALVSGSSAISTPVSPTVAGALSLDTKQAGYLFTLPTLNGTFKGGTLWGR